MSESRLDTAPTYNAATVANLFVARGEPEMFRPVGNPPIALPGFVTFFDPGYSILRIRTGVRGTSILTSQYWYEDEPFASLRATPGYRELRMNAVKDSFGKTFDEQQKILPPDEEVPFARVVVMGIIIHFLATGERLLPSDWVRCRDVDSGGDRVIVGHFDQDGLHVDGDCEEGPYSGIGLSSSRKF